MAFTLVSLFLETNLSMDVVVHSCSYEKDMIQVTSQDEHPKCVASIEPAAALCLAI